MKKVKKVLWLNIMANLMVLLCYVAAYILIKNEIVVCVFYPCFLGVAVLCSAIAIFSTMSLYSKIEHKTIRQSCILEFFRLSNAIVFGWTVGVFVQGFSANDMMVNLLGGIITSGIGSSVAIIAYFVAGKIAKRSFRIEEALAQ